MAIDKIVVDDELMIRKALETQLRNKRYSVASAGDLSNLPAKFWQGILSFWIWFFGSKTAGRRGHGSFGGAHG